MLVVTNTGGYFLALTPHLFLDFFSRPGENFGKNLGQKGVFI